MLDKLFEKWLDDVFVMLMSKSKKEVARLAFRAGYHACESAQQSVQADAASADVEDEVPYGLSFRETEF